MKRYNSAVLIEELMSDTRNIILEADKLQRLDSESLQMQPTPGRWSVAQVLEHLNFYSRFYLRAIEEKLHRNDTRAAESFTPGWFGDYFTRMMKPTGEKKIRSKMKALKNATPPPEIEGRVALRQFLDDQHTLLNLLEISKTADIGRIRVPTSITSLISLKLGDTFRFFIAHEQRHMLQISNTLSEIGSLTRSQL